MHHSECDSASTHVEEADWAPALRVHPERGRRLFVLGERIERDRAFSTRRLEGVDRSRRGGALEVGELFLELGNMRGDSRGRRAADGHDFLRSDKPCVLVAYCFGCPTNVYKVLGLKLYPPSPYGFAACSTGSASSGRRSGALSIWCIMRRAHTIVSTANTTSAPSSVANVASAASLP